MQSLSTYKSRTRAIHLKNPEYSLMAEANSLLSKTYLFEPSSEFCSVLNQHVPTQPVQALLEESKRETQENKGEKNRHHHSDPVKSTLR